MQRVRLTEKAAIDIVELATADATVKKDYAAALKCLMRGRDLPEHLDDHGLFGQLVNWRAFSVGEQDGEQGGRVVYFVDDDDTVIIVAAGPHEEAHARAQRRRADKAGKPSRAKAKTKKAKP